MITVDDEGVLREPHDLHDARFRSISVEDGVLRLSFVTEDGVGWSFTLPKIKSLSVDTFEGSGNIVFEIEIFHKCRTTFDFASKIDLAYGNGNVHDAIAEGRLTGFFLSSSYGAEIAALSTAKLDEIVLVKT